MKTPSSLILSRFLGVVVVLAMTLGTASQAQDTRPTLAERLKAKAAALMVLKELDPRDLDTEQVRDIVDALILGVEYGNQAKVDEEAGYEFAHQKAAYDWGYHVGDPKTVKMVRFFWEGVQLSVFAVGDFQQHTGAKPERWAAIEAMVGGNGEEYDVNKAYIDDIFDDVQIAVDGAQLSMQGQQSNFQLYFERWSSGND